MKKFLVVFAMMLVAVVTLFALGCSRGGMMMNNDQMMDHMRNNPQMMQQMMDQMMRDPKMAQQMAETMMKNPEHCGRMAEHMSKNPEACRNMMQGMANQMDSVSAQQMMQHCEMMMKNSGKASAPTAVAATRSSAGVQEATVNVTGNGFSPATINVTKGEPVRIHFKRDDQPTCADEVVFADLNIRRKLPANATTTVEVTPQKEGSLTFACGMNMLKGSVVVQ